VPSGDHAGSEAVPELVSWVNADALPRLLMNTLVVASLAFSSKP